MSTKKKIVYAYSNGQSREGELEFLYCNQKCWCSSEKRVRQEIEEQVEEYQTSADPNYTYEEAMEDLGPFTVMRLTVEVLP
jgi:hypothetical protein